MKSFFAAPLPDHLRNILRRLGYAEIRTKRGQISYAKRVGGNRFPRYHAYVEERDGGMQVNLHVDQKEASYEGSSAHGGEYEGPLVEQEMQRIGRFIQAQQNKATAAEAPAAPAPQKKGFVEKLFDWL